MSMVSESLRENGRILEKHGTLSKIDFWRIVSKPIVHPGKDSKPFMKQRINGTMGRGSRALTIVVLPIGLVAAFSPDTRMFDTCRSLHRKTMARRRAPTSMPSDALKLHASLTPSSVSVRSPVSLTVPEAAVSSISNATTLPDNSTWMGSYQSKGERTATFLGFPIEKNAELGTDQRILGEVLKEPMFEVTSVFLVLFSSLLVAVSTVNSVDLQTLATIIRLENVIACVFALEFFARWFSRFTWKGIVEYLLQPMALIDLVVVILPLIPLLVPFASSNAYEFLPSWLFSSTGLVNLRLLRVLRLQRVLTDRETFADFQIALGIPRTEVKPYKLELARVVISIFTLLSISTGLIYSTEHSVNSAMPTYFDALYFSLTTLTSVGFGDITPVTAEGKLVVSGSILVGVAVIPVQAAALVEALLAREHEKSGGESPRSALRSPASSSSRKDDRSRRTMTTTMSLETITCPNCEAGFHWTNADFCWSCGSKLDDPPLRP